jgi:hypothetical protein
VLDVATDGRLRGDAGGPVDGLTLRQLSEAGFSGRPLQLAAIELVVGTPGERRPTAWERMFLPAGLRDGVRARLGVQPEQVHAKQAPDLATSTGVGRATLVLVGVVLAIVAWRGTRRSGSRAALVAIGLILGSVALLLDAAVLAVWYPEIWRTWTLAVLWPTDLALGLLPRALSMRYLWARLAVTAVLLVLSIVGALGQAIWAPCALVLLPLGVACAVLSRQAKTSAAPVGAGALPAPDA